MADRSTKITMRLGYTNTDFERNFIITGVPASALPDVEPKAIAVNASLAGGTDGGLKEFLRADDYDASDPNNIIGELEAIKSLTVETTTETAIF